MSAPRNGDMQQEIRRKNWWVALVALWVGVIFFSSTSQAGHWADNTFDAMVRLASWYLRLNSSPPHIMHFLAEKSVHVAMFSIFAALLWVALPGRYRKVGVVISLGLVLGSASEFLQSFFPRRDPILRDVCINVAATTMGALLSLIVQRRRLQPAPDGEERDPRFG